MGKRDRYAPGTFSWVEPATTDPQGAKAFYGELFGWEAEDMPAGESATYTMLSLDGDHVGGLYGMDAGQRERGVRPYWFGYVSVEEADAAAVRAHELGGAVIEEPFDVLDAGRTAVVQDPTGAMLAAWEPRQRAGAGRVNDPGCLTWNELQTREPEKAATFYEGLFGWQTEPIREDGRTVYVTIKTSGGRPNGGILPLDEAHGDAPSFWLPYFTVASCDGAAARVEALGGGVTAGPMELGAGRVAVARDPQGEATPFQGFRTSLPVVLRPSRSAWARAASASG
ncbi:VOC family protein [Rubrobacter xylanophilus]|nr:VOC family protein [Rubrobacter xylanophilus]